MSNADYSIGVVGVGRMGSNIARHLKDEGFSVVAVYDSVSQLANSLADEIEATACNMPVSYTHLRAHET